MGDCRKRVLVTGATGTVGRSLVRNLLKQDYQVMCLVRDVPRGEKLFSSHTGVFVLKCDLHNKSICREIVEFDAATVIHLAACLAPGRSYDETSNLVESNILFGTRLLNALMETNIRLFVNTGTFKEYFNGGATLEPASLYGASKTAFRCMLDFYHSIHSFRVAHVVPGTIYGSDEKQQKVLDLLLDSLGNNEPIRLAGPDTELDLIHTDDLVDFFVKLIAQSEKNPDSVCDNSSYYVGEGLGRSLKSLVVLMEQLSGLPANVLWDAKSKREKHLDKAPAMDQLAAPQTIGGWQQQISIEQGLRMELSKRIP